MPIIEVDFDVYCTCGNGLCNETNVYAKRGRQIIEVSPCTKCLDDKWQEGYDYARAEIEREKAEKE